jgi:hypothetical protein
MLKYDYSSVTRSKDYVKKIIGIGTRVPRRKLLFFLSFYLFPVEVYTLVATGSGMPYLQVSEVLNDRVLSINRYLVPGSVASIYIYQF